MAIKHLVLNSAGTNSKIWGIRMQKKLESLYLWNYTTKPPNIKDIKPEDLAWFAMLETKAYHGIIESLDASSVAFTSAYNDHHINTGSCLWQYLQDAHSMSWIVNWNTLDKKHQSSSSR